MIYSTRRFVVCLALSHCVLVFFSPFSIAITSLGEERANLSAFPLRKQAYSNIFKISPQKTESFQKKILFFIHISVQNIDSGFSLEPPRRGGSNEYPQSMF